MVPPDHLDQEKQTSKDDNQSSSSSRKAATTRPQEQALKCPRCERYWTKGGALRSVPIGGGCRKNKKIKSSSRLSSDSKDSSGSSEIAGFSFFHGLSPTVDFNLGGLSFPRLNPSQNGLYNHFPSFGDISATSAAAATVTSPCFTLDPSVSSTGSCSLMGFNYPLTSVASGFGGAIQENIGAAEIGYAIWYKEKNIKMAVLVSTDPIENQVQKPQPIMFENLEISKPQVCAAGNSRKEGAASGDTATEMVLWEFIFSSDCNATNTSNNGNNDNTGNWNGVQAWGDLHQYSALP
ncbi:hypothetical protein NC651_018205 [Populus alba x Populus x berolinensis]|nr:hypothetical protein NC651_018205 [Populus alba x Populus x berolinensis]